MARKSPIDLATRKRETMRKSLAKHNDQGRKQVAVFLSTEALQALEALCDRYETDRGKALDALLTGKIRLPKRQRRESSQPIDSYDLFSQ